MSELDRATEQFEEAKRELEGFFNKNPGLYEHLKELMDAYNQALENLEGLVRKHQTSAGPVRVTGSMTRVDPDYWANQVEERGVEWFTSVGGQLKPTITVSAVRSAQEKGLLPEEVVSRGVTRVATVKTPPRATLPPRRTHD
jgi:hypothetical protein